MKVSCLPVSYFSEILDGKMTIKDWAKQALEVGLDGIDLSILFVKTHTPVYLKNIKKDIDDAGIKIVMITTYPDFTHPSPIERDRQLEFLKADIATASSLGAQYVRVTAGQAHPETGKEEGIKWVIEYLKQSLFTADKFGIKLVYENHAKPNAWDYVDFSHPTEIFLNIVGGTKNTKLGINFDTANILAYGDDPLPILEKVIDRVVTIHAADTCVKGELKPVLLGTGLVPFKEMFTMLKNARFDGWICIEEASFGGKENVKKSVDFVRKTWNEA
ncbi:MAG: sugar phosphate isomerase/epimerase [Planctomycetes bacterium]|nr:sugar phosphate isomerase/epimerase [Planctomycetota bacterium]